VLARSDAWVLCGPFQAPPADFWTPTSNQRRSLSTYIGDDRDPVRACVGVPEWRPANSVVDRRGADLFVSEYLAGPFHKDLQNFLQPHRKMHVLIARADAVIKQVDLKLADNELH
jgi:hypothetical protein